MTPYDSGPSLRRTSTSHATVQLSQDRGEGEFGWEGTYLKVMGKFSHPVWNNGKPQSTIIHAPGFSLLEMIINQGQNGLTKFYSMFADFLRNGTGSTPVQQSLCLSIESSVPTSPAAPWSQIWCTTTRKKIECDAFVNFPIELQQ